MVTHAEVAGRLRDAYRNGQVAPLRDGLEPTDAAGAYAVQAINTRFWLTKAAGSAGAKWD